jgi:hypothetical protein
MKLQIATIHHVHDKRATLDQRMYQVLLFRFARTTRWGSRNDKTTKVQIATINHVNKDLFYVGLLGRHNNLFWIADNKYAWCDEMRKPKIATINHRNERTSDAGPADVQSFAVSNKHKS